MAPSDRHWAPWRYITDRLEAAERLLRRAESPSAGDEAVRHVEGVNLLEQPYEPPDGAGQIALPRRMGTPIGDTEALVNAIRASHGEAFVASWLTGRTCQFDASTIWTVETAKVALERACGAALECYGVRVRVDDQSRRHFAQQTYEIAQAHPKRPPRRKRTLAR